MTENEFTDMFVSLLSLEISPCKIATRKSVLYDMAITDKGIVDMGVDIDTGEPLRGGGKGFEQDILIYENTPNGHTSFIPRIITEVKLNRITSHDVIVYSEKARRIKRIYPYSRYGLLLVGLKTIPGRVLRLEGDFDFIFTIKEEVTESCIKAAREIYESELEISRKLSDILTNKKKVSFFWKQLRIK